MDNKRRWNVSSGPKLLRLNAIRRENIRGMNFLQLKQSRIFARALGAARSANEHAARQAFDQLTMLRDGVVRTSIYWAK